MPSKSQVTGAFTILAVFVLYKMLAPRFGLPTL